MPRGDGTGPVGAGSMTGRAAGYCAGHQMPGCANPIGGRGFWGCGRGGGRGWRNRFWATGLPGWAGTGNGLRGATAGVGTPAAELDEVEALRRQAQSLEGTLGEIQIRIEQLEAKQGGGT